MRYALSLIIAALPALALAAPDTESSLRSTLTELEASREQQEALQNKQQRNLREIVSLTEQSRKLAIEVRTMEARITEQAIALARTEKQYREKKQALAAREDDIAALLYGMIRMQRLPRQFVLARPGDADELLRTASALHIAYGATDQAAAALLEEMKALKTLEAEAKAARTTLAEETSRLNSKMAALSEAMTERQQVQQRLDADQRRLSDRIDELSQRSGSLKELIERLDREEALFQALGLPQEKPKPPAHKTSETGTGGVGYPAAGTLLHRFGQKKGPGEIYSGHVLRTASGAMVSAPDDGQIVFADQFLDYGNMIIIQHDDAYHSVLAGLETLRARPGQKVAAGEPVGLMGKTRTARQLYFEVRKHSKAIDPALWMSKLTGRLASD